MGWTVLNVVTAAMQMAVIQQLAIAAACQDGQVILWQNEMTLRTAESCSLSMECAGTRLVVLF